MEVDFKIPGGTIIPKQIFDDIPNKPTLCTDVWWDKDAVALLKARAKRLELYNIFAEEWLDSPDNEYVKRRGDGKLVAKKLIPSGSAVCPFALCRKFTAASPPQMADICAWDYVQMKEKYPTERLKPLDYDKNDFYYLVDRNDRKGLSLSDVLTQLEEGVAVPTLRVRVGHLNKLEAKTLQKILRHPRGPYAVNLGELDNFKEHKGILLSAIRQGNAAIGFVDDTRTPIDTQKEFYEELETNYKDKTKAVWDVTRYDDFENKYWNSEADPDSVKQLRKACVTYFLGYGESRNCQPHKDWSLRIPEPDRPKPMPEMFICDPTREPQGFGGKLDHANEANCRLPTASEMRAAEITSIFALEEEISMDTVLSVSYSGKDRTFGEDDKGVYCAGKVYVRDGKLYAAEDMEDNTVFSLFGGTEFSYRTPPGNDYETVDGGYLSSAPAREAIKRALDDGDQDAPTVLVQNFDPSEVKEVPAWQAAGVYARKVEEGDPDNNAEVYAPSSEDDDDMPSCLRYETNRAVVRGEEIAVLFPGEAEATPQSESGDAEDKSDAVSIQNVGGRKRTGRIISSSNSGSEEDETSSAESSAYETETDDDEPDDLSSEEEQFEHETLTFCKPFDLSYLETTKMCAERYKTFETVFEPGSRLDAVGLGERVSGYLEGSSLLLVFKHLFKGVTSRDQIHFVDAGCGYGKPNFLAAIMYGVTGSGFDSNERCISGCDQIKADLLEKFEETEDETLLTALKKLEFIEGSKANNRCTHAYSFCAGSEPLVSTIRDAPKCTRLVLVDFPDKHRKHKRTLGEGWAAGTVFSVKQASYDRATSSPYTAKVYTRTSEGAGGAAPISQEPESYGEDAEDKSESDAGPILHVGGRKRPIRNFAPPVEGGLKPGEGAENPIVLDPSSEESSASDEHSAAGGAASPGYALPGRLVSFDDYEDIELPQSSASNDEPSAGGAAYDPSNDRTMEPHPRVFLYAALTQKDVPDHNWTGAKATAKLQSFPGTYGMPEDREMRPGVLDCLRLIVDGDPGDPGPDDPGPGGAVPTTPAARRQTRGLTQMENWKWEGVNKLNDLVAEYQYLQGKQLWNEAQGLSTRIKYLISEIPSRSHPYADRGGEQAPQLRMDFLLNEQFLSWLERRCNPLWQEMGEIKKEQSKAWGNIPCDAHWHMMLVRGGSDGAEDQLAHSDGRKENDMYATAIIAVTKDPEEAGGTAFPEEGGGPPNVCNLYGSVVRFNGDLLHFGTANNAWSERKQVTEYKTVEELQQLCETKYQGRIRISESEEIGGVEVRSNANFYKGNTIWEEQLEVLYEADNDFEEIITADNPWLTYELPPHPDLRDKSYAILAEPPDGTMRSVIYCMNHSDKKANVEMKRVELTRGQAKPRTCTIRVKALKVIGPGTPLVYTYGPGVSGATFAEEEAGAPADGNDSPLVDNDSSSPVASEDLNDDAEEAGAPADDSPRTKQFRKRTKRAYTDLSASKKRRTGGIPLDKDLFLVEDGFEPTQKEWVAFRDKLKTITTDYKEANKLRNLVDAKFEDSGQNWKWRVLDEYTQHLHDKAQAKPRQKAYMDASSKRPIPVSSSDPDAPEPNKTNNRPRQRRRTSRHVDVDGWSDARRGQYDTNFYGPGGRRNEYHRKGEQREEMGYLAYPLYRGRLQAGGAAPVVNSDPRSDPEPAPGGQAGGAAPVVDSAPEVELPGLRQTGGAAQFDSDSSDLPGWWEDRVQLKPVSKPASDEERIAAVKRDIEHQGYAVVPDILPKGKVTEFKQDILEFIGRSQRKAKGTGDPVFLEGEPQKMFAKNYFKSFTEYGDILKALHKPKTDGLFWSKDSIMYWKEGKRIMDLGALHRDQPDNRKKVMYQAMLLLTDQSPEAGGLAFAPSDFNPPEGTFRREGDRCIMKKDPGTSQVVRATAGSMLIWDSATWHHAVRPQGGIAKKGGRVVILLAYNPCPTGIGQDAKHYGFPGFDPT